MDMNWFLLMRCTRLTMQVESATPATLTVKQSRRLYASHFHLVIICYFGSSAILLFEFCSEFHSYHGIND
jgi:hypothetical protein